MSIGEHGFHFPDTLTFNGGTRFNNEETCVSMVISSYCLGTQELLRSRLKELVFTGNFNRSDIEEHMAAVTGSVKSFVFLSTDCNFHVFSSV